MEVDNFNHARTPGAATACWGRPAGWRPAQLPVVAELLVPVSGPHPGHRFFAVLLSVLGNRKGVG